jgi:hypothetical protein
MHLYLRGDTVYRNDFSSTTTMSSTHSEAHHRGLLRDGRDPTLPDSHPVNKLGAWHKFAILCTLSFSGFLANFQIAILQVAFGPTGKSLGVSPGRIPETIGYNLLGLGCGPLIWNPLSKVGFYRGKGSNDLRLSAVAPYTLLVPRYSSPVPFGWPYPQAITSSSPLA